VYRVRVVVRTDEDEPQEFARELTVRYQPPAPVLLDGRRVGGGAPVPARAAQAPALEQLVVDKDAFTFQALALPGEPGLDFRVRLSHRHQHAELLPPDRGRPREAKEQVRIEEKLKLRPGPNLIEVVADNKDALTGYEHLETSRLALEVLYEPPGSREPPRITLERVVVAGPDGLAQSLPLVPGQPVVVHVPQVQIEGLVQSKAALAKVQWWRSEKAEDAGQRLGPVKLAQAAFSHQLDLKPGRQWLRLLAETGAGGKAEAVVLADYRPALPRLELTAPAQGTVLYQGHDKPEVLLQGRLIAPADRHPYEAVVLVNGQPRDIRPAIDAKAQTFRARVPLDQPGDHRLQVRLSNPWQVVATTEGVQVRWLRPPANLQFEQPPGVKTDKPLIDLDVRVESPLPLLPESVEAKVQDRAIARVEVLAPDPARGARTWRVRLRDVPLAAGKNEVRCWVSNAEARCRAPAQLTVELVPPAQPPAPPEIDLVEPAQDGMVTEPELKVRFRIRSASPLRRVELVREGTVPLRRAWDLANRQPDARGFYEVEEAEWPLVPGANRLRVEAVNAGGERHAEVVINYSALPVRLAIDRLELAGQGGQPLEPIRLSDGKLLFDPLPQGRAWLHGHVTWDREGNEQIHKTSWVRVHVNGAMQIPVRLEPVAGNARRKAFKAEILLSQAQGNYVDVELPGLKQEASNRPRFRVDCQKPERTQRLHLLIVGVGEKDGAGLTNRALAALRKREEVPGRISTTAFAQVIHYGTLSDLVDPDQVFTQLCKIKKTIETLAQEGSANDVLLVYYQGEESVTREGHFFQTSFTDAALTPGGLAQYFTETMGAKLLMLDVQRGQAVRLGEVKDQVIRWPEECYVGVFRYARPKGPGSASGTWVPQLLPDLRDVLPNAGRLVQVASLLGVHSRQKASELIYSRHVPDNMEGLEISRKP
jgi:hypothetical protein